MIVGIRALPEPSPSEIGEVVQNVKFRASFLKKKFVVYLTKILLGAVSINIKLKYEDTEITDSRNPRQPRQHSLGTTLRFTGPVPADSRQ